MAGPDVLAENLRRLRLGKKLSQGELASRAGLSRVGYRNIEKGTAVPKADTLARLGAALEVGLDDLVRPVAKLSAVRFRARKRLTTREAILADVARWLEGYAFVESLLEERDTTRFDELATRVAKMRARPRPVAAARAAREGLGIGETHSIRDICGLLEDNGIKVFAPVFPTDQLFGLSVGADDGGPAVVVNTWERITVERRIFTAAHELGHLLLHRRAYDVSRTEEPEHEEKEADLFASHFLMPDEVFQKEWDDARGLSFVDAVLKVKGIFKVSWKTVVHRVASAHGDPSRVWQSFYSQYSRQYGRNLSGVEEPGGLAAHAFQPTPAVRPGEEPDHLTPNAFKEDRLRRLVRRALDEEQITSSRAAEILDVSVTEMRALASSWL